MSSKISVSVIIPFYNASSYIKNCLNSLRNQTFEKRFEIIMVDDASTDDGQKLIQEFNYNGLSIYSLKKNSGPSAARNLGLKKATGDYIFLMDVDDTIDPDSLKLLYNVAKKNECDFVFSDFKRIENTKNLRENFYNYSIDKYFDNDEIKSGMIKQIHFNSFGHLGLFGINGRLIKRSIIDENNITFDEKLRYGEDEVFSWYILGFVKNARYIQKQLYSYFVNPKVTSAVVEAISENFSILDYAETFMNHVKYCLKQRNFSTEDINRFGNQAFIYSIITVLVSYSRCMFLGKVNFKDALKQRKKIINKIIHNSDVKRKISDYNCLSEKGESLWIPRAIKWRSRWLLEIACNKRAKEIVGKISKKT